MFDEITAIEIANAGEDEIDNILDRLYTLGYMTPEGTAPFYYDLEQDFIDRLSTSPSYIVCYYDAQGNPTLEACDSTSRQGQRLLASALKLSLARASMMI